MNGRGVAAFLAGLGTGYFNSQNQKKDRERQEKKDKMEQDRFDLEMKRAEKQQAQDDALSTGMEKASTMKVGELRDESGAVDVSQEAFKKRLEEQGIAPEVAAETAPIYANSAKEKGSKEWLSNSFSTPAAAGIGKVKETTRGDIKRTQSEALAAGGKYDQSISLQDQAEKLDIDDLKARILRGNEQQLADEYDELFPDNLRLSFQQGTDGKLYKFTVDPDGNKSNWQTFDHLEDFKQKMVSMIEQDPDKITGYWKESRELDRQRNKDKQDKEKFDLDMKAGNIGIEGAQSDLKVKKATEGARIEGAGLDNKSKRASIANIYDEIEKRKLTTDKATTESQYKQNEEIRKNGDQFRQDVNSAVAIFDKSFKRDPMGNLTGDDLNSKLYSEASKVIGNEIKRGASIDDAQAIGRMVYDEALNGGVSVNTAYTELQKRMQGADKGGGKPTGGKGASAVDSYFK